MHQNTSFSHTQNPEIFCGRGTVPSLDPSFVGRENPSPYRTPQVPPLQIDPGYATGC